MKSVFSAIALASVVTVSKGVSVLVSPAPLIGFGVLAIVSRYYHHFRLVLTSLALLVAFSTPFVLCMEAIAFRCGPIYDDALIRVDAALGINVLAICAWFEQYPTWPLELVYFSVIPQTILAIAYFGFRNDARLTVFLKRFMACAVVTLIIFYFFPARGNYVDPPRCMLTAMYRFDALRAGEVTVLDPTEAEGIITFPSFHTVWAILLIALFWPSPLRYPMLALNIAMVVSTIPIGRHYFVDLVVGALVGVLGILRIPDSQVAPPLEPSHGLLD